MKHKKLTLFIVALFTSFQAVAEDAATQQLETVTVKAKAQRSFSKASDGDLRDRVNLGLLGQQNAFTTPITVVNYDEKMIQNNEPRTLVDGIAKVDASTMQFGGESNTLQGLYIRGLQIDARQFSVNGLTGMYSYQSSPTAAVASAQLIKGASSAINGMDPEGAVSGAVNIETKKATNQPINKIGVGYFSNSRVQGAADFGRRFGANQEWGVRVNGKVRKGDTPRHGYEENNREFALNGDYRGEKLRIALDSMLSKRTTTGARARVQDMQLLGFQLPDVPNAKTALIPSWQGQTSKDQTHMLTFGYDALDNLQLSGGIGYNKSHYYGFFSQLNAATISNAGKITTLITPNGDYYVGNNAKNGGRLTDQTAKTLSMNLAAKGYFDTGSISHNWSTAYDRVRRERTNYWGSAYTASIKTNLYAPNFGDQNTAPYIAPLTATPAVNTTYTSNSLALSDTLGFDNNRYRLTLGGRMQWVKQENHLKAAESGSAHRFSPMATFAWVPTADFVAYGNYLEDLEPGSIDTDTGTMSKPRVSRQIEVGVRKNWGNVVTSLNAFQITRPGYWRGSVTSGSDFAKLHAKAGEKQGKEQNRGVEFNIYGNLLNQTLRPSFGVMYLRAKLKDYPTFADNLVNGDQVASPRVIAKAGVEWDTPVKGLSLNSHVQYYGKSYQDSQRQFRIPGYALVDVGAKYSMKLNENNQVTITGAVENLFNKRYWQVQRGQYDRSFAVVGMPRTFWVKADYAF